MLCEMTYIGAGWCKCRHCPNRAKAQHPERVIANCRSGEPDYPTDKGVGTELHKIIGWFGIKEIEECQCKRRVLAMNQRGPDWCEANIDTIVGWLRESAKKRKLLFVEAIAKKLVGIAIKRTRALFAAHAK